MLNLSPSLVDSYRYWSRTDFDDPDKERQAFERFMSTVKKERFKPTGPMLLGRAFHRALESRPPISPGGVYRIVEQGNRRFLLDVKGVERIRSKQPLGLIRELWGTLELPRIDVRMRLRCDGLVGNEVHDTKTTEYGLSVSKYEYGCQWPCYLTAYEADVFVYHLVRLKHDKRAGGVWFVKDYRRLVQRRYPGMEEELEEMVAEVATFIRTRGLAHYRED